MSYKRLHYKLLFVFNLLSLILFCGCLRQNRDLETFNSQQERNTKNKITITGRIDLSNVGINKALGGYYPSILGSLLDYSHFVVFIEDNEKLQSNVSSEGFFRIENVPSEKFITLKAVSKQYPGLVLEWSGYNSELFKSDLEILISIFSTARSLIFQAAKNFYGLIISPQSIQDKDISKIVEVLATTLEKFPNKISSEMPLTHLPEALGYAYDITSKIILQNNFDKLNDWTFMVYQIPDENNRLAFKKSFDEIMRVGLNKNAFVVIQTNAISNNGTIERYILTNDNDQIKKIIVQSDISNYKISDPKLIQDFLSWCLRRYPAPNTAFILMCYGGGVRYPTINNLPVEYIQKGYGNIIEVSKAFSNALNINNFLSRKISILCFDASMMGMFEIAYQFRNAANYIAFSQGSVPSHGFPYYNIFSFIKNYNKISIDTTSFFSTQNLANEEFITNLLGKIYIDSYEKINLDKLYSGSISIVKCSELEKLKDSFSQWVNYIYQNIHNFGTIINALLRVNTQNEIVAQVHDKYFIKTIDFVDYKDFYDLVTKIKDHIPLSAYLANELLKQFNKTVIYNGYFGKLYKDCKGISIALPTKYVLQEYIRPNFYPLANYSEYDLCKSTLWDELLKKLAESQEETPVTDFIYSRGLAVEISWSKSNIDIDLELAEPYLNEQIFYNISQTPISYNGYFSIDSAISNLTEEYWKANYKIIPGKYYVALSSKDRDLVHKYNDIILVRVKINNKVFQNKYELKRIMYKKFLEIEVAENNLNVIELKEEKSSE